MFTHTLHEHSPSASVTPTGPAPTATSKYLLLVSGLQIGTPVGGANPNSNVSPGSSELSAQLLVDFVAGRLGGQAADIDIASKIARYVFLTLLAAILCLLFFSFFCCIFGVK